MFSVRFSNTIFVNLGFRHGIAGSLNHILQKLDPKGEKPIHLSFDIDSLDALEAPSTGTAGLYVYLVPTTIYYPHNFTP